MRKIERDDENPIDNIIIDSCDIIKPYFYKLGFNPNGITTLSLIFGLLSVYFLYQYNRVAFGLLYFISYYFDCLDGYYARSYKMITKFGDLYDHIKDFFIILLIVIVFILKFKFIANIHIYIIIFIFYLLTGYHLQCQERIYNKPEEGASINGLPDICKNNPSEQIKYTRYFGFGTGTLSLIIAVFFLKRK
jgi:hypothetical protein